MFRLVFWFFIFGLFQVSLAQTIQLSPPKANIQMAMVSKKNPKDLTLDFRMEGASIRYTLDGTEPTIKSKRYKKLLKINKPCTIKAKAFHNDFTPSDAVTATFVPSGKKILSYRTSEPNPKYAANGAQTLFDGQFGGMSFAKNYLGYDKGIVEITIQPDADQLISNIHISHLTNQGAWIFGPSKISVIDENGKLIFQKIFDESINKSPSNHTISSLRITKNKYHRLKVVIEPVTSIPDWHDGRGNPAWLFLDEVWVE